MKRTLSALFVGALVVLAAAPAVSAQQNSEQATFGNLVAALNNISAQIDNLEALNDLTVEDVRVVSADNLLRGANVEALNNALNRNNVEVLRLRDVLNDNEIIKNALNNNNVAVNDVVAIDVLSGGEVVVFTQPQM